MKKRGYYVYGYDEEWGVGVVAHSVIHAKTLAFRSGEFLGEEWIDIKSRWIHDANVSGMPIGIVPTLSEGLKRGFYLYIEDYCEYCGREDRVELYSGLALCSECIKELQSGVK